MKVALIGNMNNNFFSLMRYMRDKGVDAHLLLYKDELDNFKPESDTWEIEKWKPYIHQTNLWNGSIIKYIFTSRQAILKELEGYDFYIANGFSPALFFKAKKKLNVFIPYSPGIEFIWEFKIKPSLSNGFPSFRSDLFKKVYQFFQKKGLEKFTDTTFVFEKGCEDVARRMDVNYTYKAMPMLYIERSYLDKQIAHLEQYVQIFKRFDWVLFSHVSHRYLDMPEFYNFKKNDILIKGFAKYVNQTNAANALLVLLEYGKDVWYSKKLVEDLGISKNVIWIPMLMRKEIMFLLQHVHIGGSEFGGLLWGGTGWEFMASGIPFLHFLKMTPEEFEKSTNTPMLPILQAITEDDIKNHLMQYQNNPDRYREMGDKLKSWFEQFNGQALAETYIDYIHKNHKLF